jgi:site-specific DNA recombinase
MTKKNSNDLEAVLQNKISKQYNKGMQRGKRFGVVYTRVSSQEQAENNSSLEVQMKLCKEYAKRENIVIKEYFGGSYESAKTDGRKEFQRMLGYAKKDKDVSFIIIYSYDRFSRTGPAAAKLSGELFSLGIVVKSVTQNIDNSTPTGQLQENFVHLFNHYDNQQRASRTKINTREIMLKGYWPYHTPLGYQNLKVKHRACDHQYVITEQGKWLKKAFQLKSEGVLTNQEIIEQIKQGGINLNEKNFRWVISNPFYAGYVTGNLINGKLVKGRHPALIDLETFLKANDLLNSAPTVGIAKKRCIEELPLKVFARDEISGCQLTGYQKKGHWYYKARNRGVKVNINANKLNIYFTDVLKNFEYDREYKEKLKKAISDKLRKRLENSFKDGIRLKKRVTEIENQVEALEERYVKGVLEKRLFDKYATKYSEDIGLLKLEMEKTSFDSSNLEKIVEKGVSIAENISRMWVSADFRQKQKLQYLVFPKGILYNKENDAVRTEKVNAIFAEIRLLAEVLEKKKKGNLEKDCLKSDSVPGTGFEPAQPFGCCHLKTVRLPISPPGLF